jgi:hypothetical protein
MLLRKVPVIPNSRLAHRDVSSVSCKGMTGTFPATNPIPKQSNPPKSAG